jgi:hypothetical protein
MARPRSRCRWEDNVKLYLLEIGRVAGIDLAQNRDKWVAVVNTVMNFWVPKNAWGFIVCVRTYCLCEDLLSELGLIVCVRNNCLC